MKVAMANPNIKKLSSNRRLLLLDSAAGKYTMAFNSPLL
jgi:hypothetical protein